jgi:hypothetical protein
MLAHQINIYKGNISEIRFAILSLMSTSRLKNLMLKIPREKDFSVKMLSLPPQLHIFHEKRKALYPYYLKPGV